MTLTNVQFQELIDSAAKASFSDNRHRAKQLETRALSQLNDKQNAVAGARLIIAAKALIDAQEETVQISQYLEGKLERIPSVLAISITLWGGELLKEVSPLYRNLIDPHVKILLDAAEERLTTPVSANAVDEELGSFEIGLLDGEAIYDFAQESTDSVVKLRAALAAFIDSDRQTLTKQTNSVDGAVEAEPLGELLALFDDLTSDHESSSDDAEEALTTAVGNSPANYQVSAYKTYRLTIDRVLENLNKLAQDLIPQELESKDRLPQ